MRLVDAFLRLNKYQRSGYGILAVVVAIALINRGVDIIKAQVKRQRSLTRCLASTPLTDNPSTAKKAVESQLNGIRPHNNTLIRRLPISEINDDKLPIVIFPKALSGEVWQRLPTGNIALAGAGGEANWKDVISPDNYYLVKVPAETTGLVFSRLCHRNGDVGVALNETFDSNAVWPIIGRLFQRNLTINDTITIRSADLSPLAIGQYDLIINAGSNQRDALGQHTQVYYTTKPITIPQEFVDGPEGKYSF